MTLREFKRGIQETLRPLAFVRDGPSLVRRGTEVATVIGYHDVFESQWHLDVGFWLLHLGARWPTTYNKCHLYFRLDRLFPEHEDTIRAAGNLVGSDQVRAYGELRTLLQGPIDQGLRELATTDGLRKAYADGRLQQGLILKEARAYLTARLKPG